MRTRLGILATHPVQYLTPWYRALAHQPGIDLQVYYMHTQSAAEQANAGFGVAFDWDIPLLDGYRSQFLRNISKTPTLDNFYGCNVPEIEQLIKAESIDALIVQGWNYLGYWQAIHAAEQTGIPVLVRGDSHLHTNQSAWVRALKYPLYRWFIPRFKAYLTVGKWNADYYRTYGADPARFFQTPHSVDNAFFEQAVRAHDRRSLRAAWGFKKDQTVFLLAGKLTAVKRPFDFVRAVAEAARRAPVGGLIVGDGPLRASLEIEARRLKAPVYFRGFLNQTEMPQAYCAADVLVMSSEQETWGMVVNEAMAAGLPAVVSDHVGCSPDLISAGDTGFVYRRGSVKDLASIMAEFPLHSEWAAGMGAQANARVRRYSISAAVQGTLNAVQTLVDSSRTALCA